MSSLCKEKWLLNNVLKCFNILVLAAETDEQSCMPCITVFVQLIDLGILDTCRSIDEAAFTPIINDQDFQSDIDGRNFESNH